MSEPLWINQERGPAPPIGSFNRRADGRMALHGGVAPVLPARIIGTDPDAYPARTRNAANRSVYTLPESALNDPRRRGAGVPVRVPVVGEIAAGQYDVTVAYHDYLDQEWGLEIDRALVRADSGLFALRVRGTSMTHVGIEPGDMVVVHRQEQADDGDLVVAELVDSLDPEGYVTLKRYYRRHDHVFLQSATADKDPIRLFPQGPGHAERDRVRVQGKVVVVVKADR